MATTQDSVFVCVFIYVQVHVNPAVYSTFQTVKQTTVAQTHGHILIQRAPAHCKDMQKAQPHLQQDTQTFCGNLCLFAGVLHLSICCYICL